MFSDSCGDVAPGSIGGLVHEDTRFVSRWGRLVTETQVV